MRVGVCLAWLCVFRGWCLGRVWVWLGWCLVLVGWCGRVLVLGG